MHEQNICLIEKKLDYRLRSAVVLLVAAAKPNMMIGFSFEDA